MASKRKFRLVEVILSVICVVFVAEAAAPAAAIGNSQFFWWIFLMVAFLLPCGLVVSELGTSYAESGGLYGWVRRAFGDKVSSRLAWYYWVHFPLWLAALAFLFCDILGALLGRELGIVVSMALELAFVWIIVFMSFSRISDSEWVLNLSAVLKVGIALLVGGLGVMHATRYGFANDMSLASFFPSLDAHSLSYLSVILLCFMGFDIITTYAGEMKNPRREIPLSIIIGGVAIAAIYLFSSFGIGAAVPVKEISLDSGILDAVAIMAGEGSVLFVLVGVLFLITLFGNLLSWSFGVNYVASYAAERHSLPRVLSHKSKKNLMPTGASAANGVVASAIILLSPLLKALGVDNLFWVFFSLNIVFLLVAYIPLFPAFLKLRTVDARTKRVFSVPGKGVLLRIIVVLPVVLLVLAIAATIIPLSGTPEELAKIPMLIGAICFVVLGELVHALLARKQKKFYLGIAQSGDPNIWDAEHKS